MRRWTTVIICSIAWAVAGLVLITAVGWPLTLQSLAGSPIHSELINVLRADHWLGLGKLLFPPVALGTDLLLWTVGTVAWLMSPEGWPGSALGRVLSPYPTLV